MLHFSRPQDEQILSALAQPEGETTVVFDTDAFNEIEGMLQLLFILGVGGKNEGYFYAGSLR